MIVTFFNSLLTVSRTILSYKINAFLLRNWLCSSFITVSIFLKFAFSNANFYVKIYILTFLSEKKEEVWNLGILSGNLIALNSKFFSTKFCMIYHLQAIILQVSWNLIRYPLLSQIFYVIKLLYLVRLFEAWNIFQRTFVLLSFGVSFFSVLILLLFY